MDGGTRGGGGKRGMLRRNRGGGGRRRYKYVGIIDLRRKSQKFRKKDIEVICGTHIDKEIYGGNYKRGGRRGSQHRAALGCLGLRRWGSRRVWPTMPLLRRWALWMALLRPGQAVLVLG